MKLTVEHFVLIFPLFHIERTALGQEIDQRHKLFAFQKASLLNVRTGEQKPRQVLRGQHHEITHEMHVFREGQFPPATWLYSSYGPLTHTVPLEILHCISSSNSISMY